ncbi:hypothetical protein WMO40_16515 [Bacillaceae bacterium CLA-AA-H227]|uniref:Uncharacterized protein n=1 Tax=Robertmurraya yapensis (ex Hitch et al 2024) TaxID=3133160 RepID=A0ACC6SEI6_9BACI
MIELVGNCFRCNKNVYCTDGFLNGITLGGGRILCFSCKEDDPLIEILNRLLIVDSELKDLILHEGGEVKVVANESVKSKEDYEWVLEDLDRAAEFGMDISTKKRLTEIKIQYVKLLNKS